MHAVLVLDHAHVNGGLAKVALDSAVGLRARGHAVTILAAVGPVDERLAPAGVRVELLDQPDVLTTRSLMAFGLQWLWNGAAARRLAAILAGCERGDTVVHVHGWAKAISPAIGPVLAGSGLPVIFTLHEYSLACPNGGFYDYPVSAACHRRPLSAACIAHNCDSRSYLRKLMRVGRHLLVQAGGMVGTAPHVVTISHLQRDLVRPYLPDGTIFHHIDNPVAVDPCPPRAPDAPLGDYLFVGRLSAEKGPLLFAEAARRAGRRAVFAGDGPQAQEIRDRYPEARLLGWQGPEAVRRLMREARALVFPSVWYEGQPLTVQEALALGTPVIVSDLCAGREAVADGRTGLWFRSADADALAAALGRLADDDIARAMGAAAHADYWRRPLTLARHLDGLEAAYESCFAARAPASPLLRPAAAASP